jgi:alpha-tubulin suppressor-like RCC1 family protein
VVDIYDPSLTVIATNDDRDTTTFESRVSDVVISVNGTYFIRVTSYTQLTVGHYELLITVNAEPVARVQIDPPSATILPGSTVDLEGRTFDQFDVELFGREAIWSSSDDVFATVDGTTGLVTAQSLGTATITFESEGIQGTAAITVTVPNTATSISAGNNHSCAIADGGTAYCWGENSSGQLGDGTNNLSGSPTPVANGLTFASISAGDRHSCGLAPDGTAYCWGEGGNGQLGDNTYNGSNIPVAVAGGLLFAEISASQSHTCGITTDGVPYCWGGGWNGQLGDGTTNSAGQPVAVAGGHTFRSIATGWNHSCGVDSSGNAFCWGWNGNRQLGDGTTSDRTVPVQVSQGALVFVAVRGGNNHSCALTDAGDATDPSAVYCWGYNGNGQLGDATNNNSSTPVNTFGAFLYRSIDVGPGGNHTCAVTTTDVALCWGQGWDGQVGDGTFNSRNIPTAVGGGLSFAEITAGANHSCGRETTSGDAYCWGTNSRGALGTGDPLNTEPALVPGGAASVAAGASHSCVLSSGGSASCFGYGGNGQLGQGLWQDEVSPVAVSGGFTFVSVEAGAYHTCGLETSPGNIYCWGRGGSGELGNGSNNQTNAPASMVSGGHSFVEVSGGEIHSCGLTPVGDVYCWGNNDNGQLGDATNNSSLVPVPVSVSNIYSTVTVGDYHSCALTNAGSAYCWGNNGNGQLGNATNTESWAPVPVSGGRTFVSLEAGAYHTCGLETSPGNIYCWGRGWDGQLGNNQNNEWNSPQAVVGGFTFTNVTTGSSSTCGILSTGETMCWGGNWAGQLGDGTFNGRGLPTTVTGNLSFIDLGAGGEHTCGVTAAGSLYCWGGNNEGQLGLGFTSRSGTPRIVAGGLTFVTPPLEER